MPRRSSAIVLSPEAPYPPIGGGALRTASLIEYLRQKYQVTLITFKEAGAEEPAAKVPADIVVRTIELPAHSRATAARAVRNLRRAVQGVPPLVDRFSGFEAAVHAAVEGAQYDVGIIEHFWCAPYVNVLRPFCERIVLDLHNIESVLLTRQAASSTGIERVAFRRFADACRTLEQHWLPLFDDLLFTSRNDRDLAGRGVVYPNALPELPLPERVKRHEIAFSGNFGYEPNQSAVRWFLRAVWPELQRQEPDLMLRLIGRNEQAISELVRQHTHIQLTGPVNDAIGEIARAKVAVVPVISGSGTRVKIIEAWAAAVPVISTTTGAEGLPAISGEHLLIADTPGEFVAAVESLLNSPELQLRLGSSGRRLYEQRLTWRAVWTTLEDAGL